MKDPRDDLPLGPSFPEPDMRYLHPSRTGDLVLVVRRVGQMVHFLRRGSLQKAHIAEVSCWRVAR